MVERHPGLLTAVRRATVAALLLAVLPAGQALAAPGSGKQSPQSPAPGTAARGAPKSAADPKVQRKAQELLRRLDQLYAAMESLSQELVQAGDSERQLRKEQADLQVRRRVVEQQLVTSQQRLDLLRQSPRQQDGVDVTTQSGQQQDEIDVTTQSVQQVRHQKSDLDRVGVRVAFHLVRQHLRSSGVQAQRKQLDQLTKRLQATLKGLDGPLKGALEAQQQRDEAQRRAAYDNWAASLGGPYQPAWMQSGRAAAIAVAFAMRQLGKPYQWGAEGPAAFDCSGLTSAAYLAAGVVIPRVAADQFYAGANVGVADLLPGDLVFYANDPANPATIHHVGMYIGNGLMVHAPHTGDVVRIASIWRSGYAGAVRVIPGAVKRGASPPTTAPVPVPTPPMSTFPPPTTSRPPSTTKPDAPPTTGRPPSTTGTAASPTTAPATTSGGTTTSSGTTSSGTTSSGTTTSTEPPTTAAPTTDPPTTAAPTTAAPTTDPPTTAAPTTDPPTTAGSTAADPSTTTTTEPPTSTSG
jgi:cell wall-associated NlpC family hydrolase